MFFLIITKHDLFNKVKFSLFDNYGARNSGPIMQAFAHSLIESGHQVFHHDMHADVAVIWSVLWQGRMKPNQLIWDSYRNTKRPVIVLEVGGLRRGHTWRVGLNGVNGQAQFGRANQGPERALQLGLKMRPWRADGNHIIITTQQYNSQQWAGMPSTEEWIRNTVDLVRQYSQRPIVLRIHPRSSIVNHIPGVQIQQPTKLTSTYDCFDFHQSLERAWAVINWNSNPGIESVLAGIPAFVGHTSLAAPVANLDWSKIEKPRMPDRQQWINDLAYTEWTVEEISQGLPLSRLLPDIEQQVIAARTR